MDAILALLTLALGITTWLLYRLVVRLGEHS
jgi:hypothetical protein